MSSLSELLELKNLCFPLFVIYKLGRPVGEAALARICNMDPKTARRCLVALLDRGYLSREYRFNGYVLTDLSSIFIRGFLPNVGEKLEIVRENFPLTSPTTTTSLSLNNIEILKAVDLGDREKIPNHREEFPIENASAGTISDEVLDVLRSCGIGEPKRSRLARLPFINRDYIERWKAELRQRGKLTPPLLIHCLETGESPPEPEPQDESQSDITAVFDRLIESYTPHPLFGSLLPRR